MRRTKWGLGVGAAALAILAFAFSPSADAVPQGFQREFIYRQAELVYPTNLEFAPDGRIFITEKRGVIKTAESPGEPLSVVADMRGETHSHWDRGMLGLAVHPDYPGTPYIYVLYAHGTPLDVPKGPDVVWESGPAVDEDQCTDPGGGTKDGCVVSARLARITVDTDTLVETNTEILIKDWCQQFPSHSIGDLVFGPDEALYVSAGDGASFGPPDYGQLGGTVPNTTDPLTPKNPCGDPPAGAGGDMDEDTAQGGAFRAQSLLRSDGPVVPNGSILRINPMADPNDPSTLALPDNPLSDHSKLTARLMVAHGLRNPYRFTLRPGTNDLYIADVGYNTWEEINRHPNPLSSVRNFGWPCYEGGNGQSEVQPGYAPLGACQAIDEGDVTPPFFSYRHTEDIEHPANDDCPPAVTGQTSRTSSSATGIAFYDGDSYPGQYHGALFGSDYSRECIWVMQKDASGVPDPDTVSVFHYEPTIWERDDDNQLVPKTYGITPVDLEMGPDGRLYGLSFMRGQVFRFNWLGSNHAPVAQIDIQEGTEQNQYVLDATGSFDPDGHALTYAWDLNGDGQYDGGTDPVVTQEFPPGSHVVGLRVTDSLGASDTTLAAVINGPQPVAEITSPAPTLQWAVGQTIALAGQARDGQDNPIPASRLRWRVLLNHCGQDGTCHQHQVTELTGDQGSFAAPDHEQSSLQITLNVMDEDGRVIEATDRVVIDPKTVDLTFDANVPQVEMTVWSINQTTPFSVASIVNSQVAITAPATVTRLGATYDFVRWSQGGERNQTLTTPANDATFTAIYQLRAGGDPFRDDDGSIFEDDIEWLAARGITRGCNPPANDLFCPDARVTRGQMAAFFVRALGLDAGAGSDEFADDDGHLFETEIDVIASAGITRGCNPPANDRFCPDAFVTRGQMAAFFVRAFGLPSGLSNLFEDDDGHIFEAEIDRLATADITRGCNPPTNDRFCPDAYVTRGQMAAFFHRAVDWLP